MCGLAVQPAGRRPEPAPAEARAAPKQETEKQLARRERRWELLRQKHLTRALARKRTALGLRMWCEKARVSLAERPVLAAGGSGIEVQEAGSAARIRLAKLRIQRWYPELPELWRARRARLAEPAAQ